VDRSNKKYPVMALVQEDNSGIEEPLSYTAEGFYRFNKIPHSLDLVEATEWDDFKVDEPVMVRGNENADWCKRYFAGISSAGWPMAWNEGYTSWLADGKTAWGYCRRPTKEELNA